jgi:hypothetical protein
MTGLEERLNAPSGYSATVSQLQGAIGASRVFNLNPKINLRPGFFTLVPWRKGKDGNTSIFSTHFSLQLERQVFRQFSLSGGLGIWWESMLSFEQTIELGNGLGTTEFYTPQRWTQVLVPTLSIGVLWKWGRKWEFQISGIAPQFTSNEKRQIYLYAALGLLL